VCDTIAAIGSVTSTGATLFAKNSDRDYKEAQYLEWVRPARHGPGELRRNLDEADEAVVESFHQERTELESDFLNRVAECPAIEDTATRARAEAVIENCWRQAWSFESRWLDRLRRYPASAHCRRETTTFKRS